MQIMWLFIKHSASGYRYLLLTTINVPPEHPVIDTTVNIKLLIAYCCISYRVMRKRHEAVYTI
jgi:hypothetical protein